MADPVIRFCALADGTRVAYSTHGAGPLLVCPAWWVSHLERDWKHPAFRDFFSTLAVHRTVVRYDRPGVGLSTRERKDFTQEKEVGILDAVVARLAEPTIDLLAFSCAAPVALAWAAANCERVRKIVFVGAYACGSDLGAENIRDALMALVEAHWGMGAEAINRLFAPDLSSQDARSFGRDQQASSSAKMAAKLLGLTFALDAREAAARVSCPALVIHRKGDHTVRFEAGRNLAADLPNATFLPLEGGAHLPWLGDAEPILTAILAFLNDTPAADVPAVRPTWKRTGDIWTIRFGERTIHLKHAKGLADLSVLLSRPGQSVEALELYAGPEAPRSSAPEPVVDRQALVAYRSRLTELAGELEQAEQRGDVGWSERVQSEHEALLEHLQHITGLGDRVRAMASPAERARKAVSARIRDAIAKVGGDHPELAAHLTATVSTGATCIYQPELPIAWDT
jgi:pimeloyl-ACP methyl ester carboxylesterase